MKLNEILYENAREDRVYEKVFDLFQQGKTEEVIALLSTLFTQKFNIPSDSVFEPFISWLTPSDPHEPPSASEVISTFEELCGRVRQVIDHHGPKVFTPLCMLRVDLYRNKVSVDYSHTFAHEFANNMFWGEDVVLDAELVTEKDVYQFFNEHDELDTTKVRNVFKRLKNANAYTILSTSHDSENWDPFFYFYETHS